MRSTTLCRCAGRRSATGAVSGVKAVASSPKLLSRSARVGHRGNKAACEVCHRAPASQSPVVVRAAADVEAPPTSDMPESWTAPPKGFKVYETMIIYNPDAQDGEREDDIQDFQDLLTKLGALDVAVSYENVPQRMAYPIEGYNVGIYVLFMYSAPASAAKAIQGILAAPSIEKEKTILRFMTTRA